MRRAKSSSGNKTHGERHPWRARWDAFWRPVSAEKRRYLQARWAALPGALRTPRQMSGRQMTHCAFTAGAGYCSFRCTHCYLPPNANRTPIPSLDEMKEQIDANRRLQGPGGGLQITGGDVADAYWKAGRADELVEIVRYARDAGLVPMLMTHGQTLLEHPAFLERLMREGGLRQMAVHIDRTQAGRRGFPFRSISSEADLHPLREAFTELARSMTARTGAPLQLSHNCTVTRTNINDVPEVVRWFLAKPERTRVWRILSFLPEADTGRTRGSARPVSADEVWEKLCEGAGVPLRRDATLFGHPACNSWDPLIVARPSGRLAPLLPRGKRGAALVGRVLAQLGGISFLPYDESGTRPYRLAGALLHHPFLALRIALNLLGRALSRELPWAVLRSLLLGRVHAVGIGIHNFMDAAQVANAAHDPVVKARLDACVFKGALKENGVWTAVPMCAMNQRRWKQLYAQWSKDPALQRQRQAGDRPKAKMPCVDGKGRLPTPEKKGLGPPRRVVC